MGINLVNLDRKFVLTKKSKDGRAQGETITIEDPGSQYNAKQVRDFYTTIYPELANANVHGPEIKGNMALYTFQVEVGTKG
jgi:PRTRC genetic system protein C